MGLRVTKHLIRSVVPVGYSVPPKESFLGDFSLDRGPLVDRQVGKAVLKPDLGLLEEGAREISPRKASCELVLSFDATTILF